MRVTVRLPASGRGACRSRAAHRRRREDGGSTSARAWHVCPSQDRQRPAASMPPGLCRETASRQGGHSLPWCKFSQILFDIWGRVPAPKFCRYLGGYRPIISQLQLSHIFRFKINRPEATCPRYSPHSALRWRLHADSCDSCDFSVLRFFSEPRGPREVR